MPQEYKPRTANDLGEAATRIPAGRDGGLEPRDPRVSVVMAAYNGEPYLAASIASVLAQDVTDIELIVVDDCSTDRTPDIVRSFNDSRIIYHHNERNLGQTPSLNLGLRLARGEYIARIDADDEYLPGKIRTQVEFMDAHPRVAVCGTWAECMDEHGAEAGIFRAPVAPRHIAFRLIWSSPVCHVSVLMRREPLLDVGGYDESFRYAADHRLWSELAARGHHFANIPRPLVRYRVFASSFGGASVLGEAGWESARIIRDNAERFCQLHVSLEEARAIHLRAQPAWGREAERLVAYRRLREIAWSIHRPPPLVARLELFGGLVWSIASTPEAGLRERGNTFMERLGLLVGRSLRRLRPRRLARLKSHVLSLVRSSRSAN